MRQADIIAKDIENRIVTGELDHGVRLDEVSIAERHAVSRTPVREALQLLTASGMVEHLPRRGVFVRQPDLVELLQMFETMAEWEGVAGRLAAMRIDGEGLARLMAADTACAAAAAAGDADRYYSENAVFHAVIYAATANAFLEGELLRLHHRLRPYRRSQLLMRGRMEQSLSEHRAIAAALRDGDANGAAAALRAHVTVQSERIHLMLGRTKAAS
ncbi:GntR family transcriptional regulator [Jannaschia donghaensis]|uniref:L-lactate utilization operon repressor n=1 Tax=Jannaschia donghaensis TaxID=420998 RepID=A0A0M6YHI1_9RHOB|nr:GntR family transcriptional regulator [Jannaschia donghaensis]CTQ48526.1 L-lactate utilization operon repressor [Jannaschia donghaensis]